MTTLGPKRSVLSGTLLWPAACATGILSALSFPLVVPGPSSQLPILEGFPREIFAVVSLGMQFLIIQSGISLKRQVAALTVAGVNFFSLLTYWLVIAMHQFGGLPFTQSVGMLFILVTYCSLYWAALPIVHRALYWHLHAPATYAFPTAVVAVDWLRSVVFTGFPWGVWGYSQARNEALAQWASIGGVFLVTWLIAWLGALFGKVLLSSNKRPLRLKTLAAVAVVLHATGWGLYFNAQEDDPKSMLKVGLLQGNIEQDRKNRPGQYAREIQETYLKLAREAVDEGAEMLVWPEAAWPTSLSTDEVWWDMPGAPPVPQLVGTNAHDPAATTDDGSRVLFNSAVWRSAAGWVLDRYDKHHLVPFGEYVPLRQWLPVDKLVSGVGEYHEGEGSEPINRWGPLVCYDGVHTRYARRAVAKGAEILANLTNDGWYGASSAPYQHRDFYVFRAIETDRWIIRATNSGVSVFVSPRGHILGTVPLYARGYGVQEVSLRKTRTAYVILGEWVVAIVFIAVILGFVRWGMRLRGRSA